MTKFQYLLSAAALSLAPPSGQAAANSVAVDRATEGLAQLLVASDLADACPNVVQRKDGKDKNTFVADGVIQLINEEPITMADLVEATQTTQPEEMDMRKRMVLARRGVDIDDLRAVCFFARQIVSADDEIGRFLEAR